MGKVKTGYFCQNCGTQYSKWLGQCNSCKSWNTIVEELIQAKPNSSWERSGVKNTTNQPRLVEEIPHQQEPRYDLMDEELNRVLGGGLVPGSVTLIGGEPGIGKSTLLLQMALQLRETSLYVSGEESQSQIKLRASRLGDHSGSCYILTETNTQRIFQHLVEVKPKLVIIDSIQTLQSDLVESTTGSVSQIRQCTSELIQFAKETNTPVILVGHITKEGTIAGPKILEHMVDTVLQFEGDRNHMYRLLRSLKNRYGSTSELGIYEMQGSGLRQVSNPSELLMGTFGESLSGTAIAASLEGQRPLMIEVQALVSTAVYGTPQRSTTGFNVKRLNMLLAVLEKKAGFKLAAKDVFLNVTGGITLDEPASDLAVVASVLSSNYNIPLGKKTCFAAEIGLSGEVRPVQKVDQRINEAWKLGFEQVVVSSANQIGNVKKLGSIIQIEKVEDLVKMLFN